MNCKCEEFEVQKMSVEELSLKKEYKTCKRCDKVYSRTDVDE